MCMLRLRLLMLQSPKHNFDVAVIYVHDSRKNAGSLATYSIPRPLHWDEIGDKGIPPRYLESVSETSRVRWGYQTEGDNGSTWLVLLRSLLNNELAWAPTAAPAPGKMHREYGYPWKT